MIQFTNKQSKAAVRLFGMATQQLREHRMWSTRRVDFAKAYRDRPMQAYWEGQVEDVDHILAGLDGLSRLFASTGPDLELEVSRPRLDAAPLSVSSDGWWE